MVALPHTLSTSKVWANLIIQLNTYCTILQNAKQQILEKHLALSQALG
jgi:hypothetical protein